MNEVKESQQTDQPELAQVPQAPRASWLAANLAFAPIALLAELLLRKTHHRPLAAATFAVAAVLLWLGGEVLARRALHPAVSPTRRRLRRFAWIAGIAATIGVVGRALFWAS